MSDAASLKAIKFKRNVFPFGINEVAWFSEKHAAAYVRSGSAVPVRDAVYTPGREVEPPPEAA